MENKQPLSAKSIVGQLLPYVLTIGILVWVFNNLTTQISDEVHTLHTTQSSRLQRDFAQRDSVLLKDKSKRLYCSTYNVKLHKACKGHIDFLIVQKQGQVFIQRTKGSRIPAGASLRVSYTKKVTIGEMWTLISKADLTLFIPVMLLHLLIFFFADMSSFGLAYKWFNAPDMTWKEILEARAGPYVVQIGLPQLAELMFPLYMWRVKKVPFVETMSANTWANVLDYTALLSVITPAVIYNVMVDPVIPVIGMKWLIGVGVCWLLVLGGIIYLASPLGKQLAKYYTPPHQREEQQTQAPPKEEQSILHSIGKFHDVFRAFAFATWSQGFRVYGARLLFVLSSLLSNLVALWAMGANIPLSLAMIGIPIITASIFTPVSVGGYGGPQLIAWFLFVKLGNAAKADQIVAYSLLWSTSFMIGRALFGGFYIRGFWRRTFGDKR